MVACACVPRGPDNDNTRQLFGPGRSGPRLDQGRSGQARSGASLALFVEVSFCYIFAVLPGRLGGGRKVRGHRSPQGPSMAALQMGAARRTNEARTRQQRAKGLGNISIHSTNRERPWINQPAVVPVNLLNCPRRGSCDEVESFIPTHERWMGEKGTSGRNAVRHCSLPRRKFSKPAKKEPMPARKFSDTARGAMIGLRMPCCPSTRAYWTVAAVSQERGR